MKNFYCAAVRVAPSGEGVCDKESVCDFLTAWLGDIGYDSFTTDEEGVKAYIAEESFDAAALDAAIAQFPLPGVKLSLTTSFVEGEDWNAEWEKNYFQPIVVGERCVVHSSFHHDVPAAQYDIVVDPKMAFGTGHHATTFLMLSFLLDNDIQGKSVIDMGTGTGILAILAAMRGASETHGIEIDPDAHANALENAALNGVDVDLICGDASALDQLPDADIFLANINRNIILADIDRYAQRIKSNGLLVVSGFYESDLDMIIKAADIEGFDFVDKAVRENWTRAVFRRR